MANISAATTGIENVILWVGPNPSSNKRRIKVSNIPNQASLDTFTITIPGLKVLGTVNENFITPQVLEQIKKWILLNLELIEEYSDGRIFTEEFSPGVKKVSG